jgi:hypothetical protein
MCSKLTYGKKTKSNYHFGCMSKVSHAQLHQHEQKSTNGWVDRRMPNFFLPTWVYSYVCQVANLDKTGTKDRKDSWDAYLIYFYSGIFTYKIHVSYSKNSNCCVDRRMTISFYLQGTFICMSGRQPRKNMYH